MNNRTPENLEIKPRHLAFELDEVLQTNWLDNSLAKTSIMNAMSILFPVGETFFITSVRAYQDQINDPVLKKQVRGFIGQEALHTREHKKYNDALKNRGYNIDKMEAKQTKRLELFKKVAPKIRLLAATVAAEHFTAILADLLLRSGDDVFKGADPKMLAVWKWHAVEETEHKAVAFDVYQQVGGSEFLRRWIMVMVTFGFLNDILGNFATILKSEGKLFSFKEWRAGLSFLMGKNGVFRRVWSDYSDYYKKGFHPWDHKNEHLIEEWVSEFDKEYAFLASA